MSASGPAIHLDYGHAYPYRVEADTSLDLTGETVVFRVGIPGPRAGEIVAPVLEHTATVSSSRLAIGTVPASATQIDPIPVVPYGYHISIGVGESRRLLVHGACTIGLAVPAT